MAIDAVEAYIRAPDTPQPLKNYAIRCLGRGFLDEAPYTAEQIKNRITTIKNAVVSGLYKEEYLHGYLTENAENECEEGTYMQALCSLGFQAAVMFQQSKNIHLSHQTLESTENLEAWQEHAFATFTLEAIEQIKERAPLSPKQENELKLCEQDVLSLSQKEETVSARKPVTSTETITVPKPQPQHPILDTPA